MNTLAMGLESFNYELNLNDEIHKSNGQCSCVECQKVKGRNSINQSQQELLELDNLYDEFEHENDFVTNSELDIEQEQEQEQERKRRGRRSGRSVRRAASRVRKIPSRKLRPRHSDKILRSKYRPRRKTLGRRPILRARRRHPLIIREPALPYVCPTHGAEFIRWVQSSLNQIMKLHIRVNGIMSRVTRNALRDFQKQEGLPVDGIAGPETETALIDAKNGRSSQPQRNISNSELFNDQAFGLEEWELEGITNEIYELDKFFLDEKVEGEINRQSKTYVRWAQRLLNKILGVRLVVDGKVGVKTRSAIRSFQKKYSLTVDGKIGPKTEAMLTNYRLC